MRYFVLMSSLIILLSASASGTTGRGWQGPVMLSDGTGGWIYPRVAVTGHSHVQFVHVVWRDLGASELKYRRSWDSGATWYSIQTLYIGNVHDPSIAVTGTGAEGVHIVWYSGPSAIMYCRSTDGGWTFQPTVTLPTGGAGDQGPQIATYINHVYVAWYSGTSNDILLMRSTDDGLTWNAPINVSNDGGAVSEYNVRLAAHGEYVYLAWQTVSGQSVNAYFRRGASNGTDWSESPVVLWSEAIDEFDYISIAAWGSNVYVDRDDATGGPGQRLSTNSGATWAGTVMLGNGTDRQPRIDVDESNVYINNGANVHIRGSGLYVSTGPATETQIGTIGGSSPSADIGTNSGDMHVVCSSQDADYEIYYYRYQAARCGDADASGGTDIDDVVYLIAYIFSGGPEPSPYESGDADCSGVVDIDDAVWLINYIFSGGDAPCDTDGDGVPDC